MIRFCKSPIIALNLHVSDTTVDHKSDERYLPKNVFCILFQMIKTMLLLVADQQRR